MFSYKLDGVFDIYSKYNIFKVKKNYSVIEGEKNGEKNGLFLRFYSFPFEHFFVPIVILLLIVLSCYVVLDNLKDKMRLSKLKALTEKKKTEQKFTVFSLI